MKYKIKKDTAFYTSAWENMSINVVDDGIFIPMPNMSILSIVEPAENQEFTKEEMISFGKVCCRQSYIKENMVEGVLNTMIEQGIYGQTAKKLWNQ